MQSTTLDYVSIVENHPSKDAIDAELRLLDDRLFLDPQWDPDFDRIVWTVAYHLGAGQEPLWIMDWRDPNDRTPLELSWGLWSKIKTRENRDPFTLRDEIKKENEHRSKLRAQVQSDAYDEIVKDMAPRITGRSSAMLHRGQHLRRSRDKLRALGYKV